MDAEEEEGTAALLVGSTDSLNIPLEQIRSPRHRDVEKNPLLVSSEYIPATTIDEEEEEGGIIGGKVKEVLERDDTYPRSIPFIMLNEICERFSYYGLRAILALYSPHA